MTHKNIYHGILIDENTLNQLHPSSQRALEQLLNGEYKSLKFEQLNTKNTQYPIFSIRANGADRLLLTNKSINGKLYFVFLEELINHTYDKSVYLKNEAKLIQDMQTLDSVNTLEEPQEEVKFAETATLQHNPYDFYHDEIIIFSENQQQALKTRLPVIISGTAGSGKTCIALKLLKDNPTQEPMLYIADSQPLVDKVKKEWEKSCPDNNIVHFKTYAQLVQEHYPNMQFANNNTFNNWLIIYEKQLKPLNKVSPNSIKIFNADEYYQEFRLIAGLTKDEYRDLGNRESFITNSVEREAMFDAFENYTSYLKNNNLFDRALSTIKLPQQYARIIVDETPDFTLLQLKTIEASLENHQVCFLMDTHQSLIDDKSLRPMLMKKFHDFDITHMQLAETYRCSHQVVQFANNVITLKNQLRGGRADKQEEIQIAAHHESDQGQVRQVVNIQEEAALRKALGLGTDFVIITEKQYIAEAKGLFDTPLILTSEQAKGLEYKTVLLYKLFDTDTFVTAGKMIQNAQLDTQKTNRAKKGQAQEQFASPLNRIFTAATRATDEVIIYQPEKRFINDLISRLLHAIILNADIKVDVASSKISLTDWLEQANNHLAAGHANRDIAKQIFESKIKVQKNTVSDPALLKEINTLENALYPLKTSASKKRRKKKKKAQASTTTTVSVSTTIQTSKQIESTRPNTATTNTINQETLISRLIKNVTKENLQALYDHDNENFLACLFNKMQSNKKSSFLAAQLVTNEADKKTLTDFIVTNKIKLTADNVNILFKPLKIHRSTTMLHEWLVKNRLSPLLLTLISVSTTLQKIIDTIFAVPLNPTPANFELLKQLLNPKWAERIIPMILAAWPMEIIDIKKEVTDNTKYFFEKLLGLLKNTCKQQPSLFFTISTDDKPYMNTSVFFWFAILNNLETDIIKSIDTVDADIIAKALCARLNSKSNSCENLSAFYALAVKEKQTQFLSNLLTKKPELAAYITAETLCALRNKNAGAHENTSVLYLLTCEESNLAILEKLFKLNPNLIKGITAEALYNSLNESAGQNTNSSVLYFLTRPNTNGPSILFALFQENSQLIKEITLSLLKLCPGKSGEYSSPLSNLQMTNTGLQILDIIAKSKPTIYKALYGEQQIKTEVLPSRSIFFTPNTGKSHAEQTVCLEQHQGTLPWNNASK